MAKVIRQGISPYDSILAQYVPGMEKFEGKLLAELPALLNGFLAVNNFKLEVDNYGNPYIVGEKDCRVSLAIGIVDGDKVCTYERNNSGLNLNNGIDVIGAVGYGLSSLLHKVPEKYWGFRVKNARIAKNYAWETTDGDGDKTLIKMPIILLELEKNPMCPISIKDIQNPTAKMQAVIEELSKN